MLILSSLSMWLPPVNFGLFPSDSDPDPAIIEHRFAFFGCFCLVSYVTISGSYLKHTERLGGPHVAVVGAGPAGFYAAQHIAKEIVVHPS
jgi:hypothetical protein